MKKLKVAKAKAGDLVKFTWVDSAHTNGWGPPESGEVETVLSVGFVVGINKEAITITHSLAESSGVLAPLTVPMVAVVELRVL